MPRCMVDDPGLKADAQLVSGPQPTYHTLIILEGRLLAVHITLAVLMNNSSLPCLRIFSCAPMFLTMVPYKPRV